MNLTCNNNLLKIFIYQDSTILCAIEKMVQYIFSLHIYLIFYTGHNTIVSNRNICFANTLAHSTL